MNIVTSFTDYRRLLPDYIIAFIERELSRRDLAGITNGAISGISVSGEHPFSRILSTYLSTTGSGTTEGLIPAISVVCGDEDPEGNCIGDKLEYIPVDEAFLDHLTMYNAKEREQHGLISDAQIALIQDALRQGETVTAQIYQYTVKQQFFVGLWTHNLRELKFIGLILSSILRMLRKNIDANMTIRTAKDLLNINFGKKLHGQESEITLTNHIRDITIMTGITDRDVSFTANFILPGEDI